MRPLVLRRGLATQILAAEVLYIRGIMLCYADRFRSGLADDHAAAAEAFEAMPLETTRAFNPTEPWLADALPETGADRRHRRR